MKKLVALFMALLMVCVIAAGCKSTDTAAETTTAATTAAETTIADTTAAETNAAEEIKAAWTITISGIGDADINFTDVDAAKMSTIEITAIKKKKDDSEVEQKWTGILLKEILDFYAVGEYSKIKVEALDGYSAEFDKAAVEDAGTIIGFTVDGKALDEEDGPAELVVSSQSSKSWVKAVAKITVIR